MHISLEFLNDSGGNQIDPALKALGNVHLPFLLRLDQGVAIKSGSTGLGYIPVAVKQATGGSVWTRVVHKVVKHPLHVILYLIHIIL